MKRTPAVEFARQLYVYGTVTGQRITNYYKLAEITGANSSTIANACREDDWPRQADDHAATRSQLLSIDQPSAQARLMEYASFWEKEVVRIRHQISFGGVCECVTEHGAALSETEYATESGGVIRRSVAQQIDGGICELCGNSGRGPLDVRTEAYYNLTKLLTNAWGEFERLSGIKTVLEMNNKKALTLAGLVAKHEFEQTLLEMQKTERQIDAVVDGVPMS